MMGVPYYQVPRYHRLPPPIIDHYIVGEHRHGNFDPFPDYRYLSNALNIV